jgi:hypothetical protein
VEAGHYLTSCAITSLPPNNSHLYANSFNETPPLLHLARGATISAMAPMTAVLTYGSPNSDYSGYLRSAQIGGGTIDGNFLASYGVDIPFHQTTTRSDQETKNTLLAGVRWGRIGAPTGGAGGGDIDDSHYRDNAYVTVTNISNSNPAAVTTQWDHGYTTGRTVVILGSNLTSANNTFFRITVTGPRTFTLDNTNSSGWGSFSGTANAALTMPSNDVPVSISSISNGNPAVVTTSVPHGLSNGDQVFIADENGISIDGIYTVAGATASTFQLSGVDATALGAYTSGGTAVKWRDPATVDKAIYLENEQDHDLDNVQLSGTRFAYYGLSAMSSG